MSLISRVPSKIVMLHAKWQRTRFGAKTTRTWNVPRSNLVISQIHKNIVRHTAHTIVSWPRWLNGYIYNSCNYHHQIGSIHLSHCYHIFSWLCAWDVCYIIFCHLLHIRSGKTGNLFLLLLCSLWWVQIVGYVLPCRPYSFVCTVRHLIIIIVHNHLNTLNL